MKNKVYLFFGVGGEYCLQPLFLEMKKRDYQCVEIDLSRCNDTLNILKNLKGKEVVFITSAHLFLNESNLALEGQLLKDSMSPLAIIDYLKPVKKVYYTHDIQDGFKHFDRLHFSLFDLWLSTLPVNAHGLRYAEIIDVGWINKRESTPKYNRGDDIKFAHSMSELVYYRSKGIDFFYNKFKDVWAEGIGVSLYRGYDEDLSKILKKNSVNILDCNKNIFTMINEYPVIITNSVSGVNIEASLSGRMVINLLDGVQSESYQRSQIGGLPNVHIVTIPEAVEMIKAIKKGEMDIAVGENILKPFDMELAIKKIVE